MKTQEIKRSDLKNIYDIVCTKWQKIITDILLWNTNELIDFPEELIYQGYEEADVKQKKLITKYFEIKEPINLFNISSFSELCKVIGIKKLTLSNFILFDDLADKMLAMWQIKVIEKAYNNGWIPDFNNHNQSKYYPYFINEKNNSFRFYRSDGCDFGFYGYVGLYKDQKTSDFVGKTFKDIYIRVI